MKKTYNRISITGKSEKNNTYDAIVVGSGISGGWAAKELCEKGLRVLLLDRGKPLVHPEYPTAALEPWDFAHRTVLTPEKKANRPIQSRHWSYRYDNADLYIDDLANPYEEKKRFDWIRASSVGGRSILWARACYRWSDLDFEANLHDGFGVDWPIRYDDIAPWYDYVEKFIGVSGSVENIPQLPDSSFLPPFEMNAAERDFKRRVETRYPDRKVIIGRTANLTKKMSNRMSCQARSLCHRGCMFGAYFSSNSSTIPAAMATGNLTLRPQALVREVLYDESKERAIGVEIIDTETKSTERFYAKLIFLNAATVATTAILLNSKSARFPDGLGNDSGQMGRNLMDHHKGPVFSATIEGFEEDYYYGRRPTGIYIPRFTNYGSDKRTYLRSYNFAGHAIRGRHTIEGLGAAYKDALCEPGGWRLSLYTFGECLPYNDNRVMLHPDKKDLFGNPMISIDCSFRDNERKMFEDSIKVGREMLEEVGYKDVRAGGQISFPGAANHEMGTVRMGRDAKTSVLNSYNQMHAVKNVFVTDGSCMTSISNVNPSLTFMALTARACDYAVKLLKRGEL